MGELGRDLVQRDLRFLIHAAPSIPAAAVPQTSTALRLQGKSPHPKGEGSQRLCRKRRFGLHRPWRRRRGLTIVIRLDRVFLGLVVGAILRLDKHRPIPRQGRRGPLPLGRRLADKGDQIALLQGLGPVVLYGHLLQQLQQLLLGMDREERIVRGPVRGDVRGS
jgi:hypothetical protein